MLDSILLKTYFVQSLAIFGQEWYLVVLRERERERKDGRKEGKKGERKRKKERRKYCSLSWPFPLSHNTDLNHQQILHQLPQNAIEINPCLLFWSKAPPSSPRSP
jgi:hypothetical protein